MNEIIKNNEKNILIIFTVYHSINFYRMFKRRWFRLCGCQYFTCSFNINENDLSVGIVIATDNKDDILFFEILAVSVPFYVDKNTGEITVTYRL